MKEDNNTDTHKEIETTYHKKGKDRERTKINRKEKTGRKKEIKWKKRMTKNSPPRKNKGKEE